MSSQHNCRSVFFIIHTPSRQSWRGRRIAPLNPGVGAGLPHSILARAQDCPTQSWRGRRIAPCFPENAGSAVLYSATPPDSPGLPGKLRKRSRKTPAVSRRPSRLQIWQVTQRKWGRSSCFLRQSTAASSPLTPWCPWCHVRASSSGRQNRAKPWL